MAKRKGGPKRIATDEMQGEGSFVILVPLKVKEVRAARKMAASGEAYDAYEEGLKMLAKHIVGWDWVGDDDEPLAVPSKHPEVLYELTNDEANYLTELLMGEDEAKN